MEQIKYPVVLICPGGGYEVCSEYGEGESYVLPYIAAGFNAFVLNFTGEPRLLPKEILGLTDILSNIVITNKNELQPLGVLLFEK